MELVCAHQPGTGVAVHRSLTRTERALLVERARGGAPDTRGQELMGRIWNAKLWLACDCRPPKHSPPLLFVRRDGFDDYLLAGMGDRPAHQGGCEFSRVPMGSAAGRSGHLSELGLLLIRWMQAARLNVVMPYRAEDLLHTQYVSLRDASKSLDLAPGRRLYDYSRSHPAGLVELHRRLTAPDAAATRSDRGVYFASVAMTSDAKLSAALRHSAPQLAHLPETFRPSTRRTLQQTDGMRGPHVALFGLSGAPNPARLQVDAAFSLPVFTRSLLVPMCAEHERGTMCALLVLQGMLFDSRGIVFSIRKTMPCTPDFERGITFQLQVMGPNGRATRSLDVVSVDGVACANSSTEAATELDWRHDPILWDGAVSRGTLYHLVAAPLDGADQAFAEGVESWVLGGAQPRSTVPPSQRALN